MIESPPRPLTPGDVVGAAASIGLGGLVLRALERGVLSPDTPCGNGTLKHIAATFGLLELLNLLILERGVDSNEVNVDGVRPLHLAIKARLEQEALFLINEAPGVDIDAPTPRGDTPFVVAAALGRMDVLRALVTKGADVNAKNEGGLSALHAAIQEGQEEAALYLIEEAAAAVYDPDAPVPALSYAAAFSLCRVMSAIVRWMRTDEVDSATVAAEIGPAALCAIEKEVELLKALVEEGLDVDQAPVITVGGSSLERPLFHHACAHGNREAAAWLLERGCDPLARNSWGERAHHVLAGL